MKHYIHMSLSGLYPPDSLEEGPGATYYRYLGVPTTYLSALKSL